MGVLPEAIRAVQMHAYRTGEVQTKEQFWKELQDALAKIATSGAISAATGGAAGVAGRLGSRMLAPLIGETFAVPVQKAGQKAIEAGGFSVAAKVVETAAKAGVSSQST
jgi:hypothetical protein